MDSKLTPMMKQYMSIKKKYQEEILFFRMGDFYEMFLEDAHIASKILDIALTARQNDIPMCGLPYHAAESYIARLIKAGKKVAICEQLESVPSSGTIVKRDVVRVITPGTIIESNLIESDYNNFLASVIVDKDKIGLAFIDISTGDFFISSIEKAIEIFRGEITKYAPKEVVLYEGEGTDDAVFTEYIKGRNIPIYRINDWLYDSDYMSDLICEIFQLASTKGLGLSSDLDIITAGSILQYLKETHKKTFDHLKYPHKLQAEDMMALDEATIANLELVQNTNDNTKNNTLFSVLNYTKTPMGKRLLERNILQPLVSRESIEERLDIVQYFHEYHDLLSQINEYLNDIYDIERLLSRFTLGKSHPRNFISLKQSIEAAAKIKDLLQKQPGQQVTDLSKNIPDLSKLALKIGKTIVEDPPLSPEQGRIIKEGHNKELDRLYGLKTDAKEWIVNYQEKEKEKLGVSTLKIKFNRVLGYYIEISKGQADNIPEHYFRKQTLVGSERFTTEELQKFESEILTSSDKIIEIEKKEIEEINQEILKVNKNLQESADIIGRIDYYCSLASCAIENQFIRPSFNDDDVVHVKEGRHPVVEKYYTREIFIPNDINFDNSENLIKIITGPNMSGKSTYIRMCAVIQLMAQIGSYIPAKEANLCIVDRIFTRIGASDNISRGESTFLVEMNETANILNNATDRSLIIMDEIGRGTSTYDGLSIAWAIVEFLLRYIKSKTLFATHYHELTKLGTKKGIMNYNVLVRDNLSDVEFLYKVVKGAADKSYGIHVANLAGIPKPIISKAEKILAKLEKGAKTDKDTGSDESKHETEQLEIFNASNHLVIQALERIDINTITPIDALNELQRIKKLITS